MVRRSVVRCCRVDSILQSGHRYPSANSVAKHCRMLADNDVSLLWGRTTVSYIWRWVDVSTRGLPLTPFFQHTH